MLVLTRKLGERICIGDNIEVMVVAVQGNRVKLGFTAPAEVPLQRAELAKRISAPVGEPIAQAAACCGELI